MKIILFFFYQRDKPHFHKKRSAIGLLLKVRLFRDTEFLYLHSLSIKKTPYCRVCLVKITDVIIMWLKQNTFIFFTYQSYIMIHISISDQRRVHKYVHTIRAILTTKRGLTILTQT